jgi:hypothetical protein
VIVGIQIIEQALGLLAPSAGAQGVEGDILLFLTFYMLHLFLDRHLLDLLQG